MTFEMVMIVTEGITNYIQNIRLRSWILISDFCHGVIMWQIGK